jgi:uncharacterized surface protein with fasciclin (FAS1) repeats
VAFGPDATTSRWMNAPYRMLSVPLESSDLNQNPESGRHINIYSPAQGREGSEMVSPIKNCLRLAAIATITASMGFGIAGCGSMGGSGSGENMSGEQLSKPDKDIIQIATGDNMGDVSTLVKAVTAADLVSTLEGPGPFTVFAPTNEAFAELPGGTLDDLMKPENKEKLKAILLYHVHAGDALMAKDLHSMSLSTADNKPLQIRVMPDGTIMVNDAKVIKKDIVAKNGVIFWIDKVVMPPSM